MALSWLQVGSETSASLEHRGDFRNGNAERRAADGIKLFRRALEMHGGLEVRDGLTGLQGERWG